MNPLHSAPGTPSQNVAHTIFSPGSDASRKAAVNAPLKVFLVEDSAHVRELLLDFLQVPGEVEIVGYADSEAESVAAILAKPVNAVIVDLKLREGGGMGVIEKLRKANLRPRPTIIVFTNHPFPEIRRRAMHLGADYFFDKSADYDSIRTILQTLRAG
jgi:DNA-binding NarL/FixJ family response regulator